MRIAIGILIGLATAWTVAAIWQRLPDPTWDWDDAVWNGYGGRPRA